jgi:Flp pilus assembly protein TadG
MGRSSGTASRCRSLRGSAAIEFALSFAFLFSVFTGVFQFGYAFYQYNALESAVRGGARHASLRTYDSSTETPSAAYLAAVRNMVVYGDPNGGVQPVARGLTPARVTVTMTFERSVPRRVAVAITNYTIDAVFTSMSLNGKPKATFLYVGRWAP